MINMKLLNRLRKKINITTILLILLLILLLFTFINNQYKSSFVNSKETKYKKKIKGRQIIQIVKTGFNQCIKLFINANQYLIYIPENQNDAINKLCSIKNQDELKTINDGIYTYIRFIDGNKKNSLFFTKNYSIQEICSKHGNILDRLVMAAEIKSTKLRNPDKIKSLYRKSNKTIYPVQIVNAGEFQKVNNKYYFNFMSGTYSRPEYESTNEDVFKDDFLNFLTQYIPEKNININVTMENLKEKLKIKTFITKGGKNNIFTESESVEYLQILIDAGFKFYLFDINDPEKDKYMNVYDLNFFNKKIEEATTDETKFNWKEKKTRKICDDFQKALSNNPESDIVKKTEILTKKVINEIKKTNKSLWNTITTNIKNIFTLPFNRNKTL